MKTKGRASGDDRPDSSDEELSPNALATKLAAVKNSQSELARSIDLLSGQIDSLQKNSPDHPPAAETSAPPPPPPQGFALRSAPSTSPGAPPPGFAIRTGTLPPPPPGFGAQPATPPPAKADLEPAPPPSPPSRGGVGTVSPASGDASVSHTPSSSLSPLDRLLGEEFGRPRPAQSIQAPPPAASPNALDVTSPIAESDTAAAHRLAASHVPEPIFYVPPLLDEETPAAPKVPVNPQLQSQPATKPAPPFSFNAGLDKFNADELTGNGQVKSQPAPLTAPTPTAKATVGGKAASTPLAPPADEPAANPPASDFFRSSGQSFASAAAMVNDILAAAPDAAPDSSQVEAEDPATPSALGPNAPEVPITPDFFTAHPRKRFRFRR